MSLSIDMPNEQIALFCRQNYIRRLSIFGSVLGSDFGDESDVDVLVEFAPGHIPGLFGIARMQRQLSEIVGSSVDLRTPEDLSRHFRKEVMQEAQVQYAEG